MHCLLLCFLLSLVSFNRAVSFDSLKRRAQSKGEVGLVFDEQADSLTSCQVTPDASYKNLIGGSSCPKAAKSTCKVCGPASVQVPQGGSITVQYDINCTWSSFSGWQSWSPGPNMNVVTATGASQTGLAFTITAGSTAKVGTQAQLSVNWCLTGAASGFAGLQITGTVVASATNPPATTAPATTAPATTHTPALTNKCPDGYDMSPSDFTSSPYQNPNWCHGVSSCQVCKSRPSWVNGVQAVVNLTLACGPITNYVSAWRYLLSTAPGATVSKVWLPYNTGTSWTLTEPSGGKFQGGVFSFANEWCMSDGYVAASASVNSP